MNKSGGAYMGSRFNSFHRSNLISYIVNQPGTAGKDTGMVTAVVAPVAYRSIENCSVYSTNCDTFLGTKIDSN